MSTIVDEHDSAHSYRRTRVPCIRFDSFAREVALHDAVVKADIEGGEAQLLDGLARSGGAVVDFVCEVLEPAWERGFVSAAATTLNADAYLVGDRRLVPASRIVAWHRADRNWLFTRRPPSVLEGVLRANGIHIARDGRRRPPASLRL
jgi:hypothetical protein